MCEPVTIGAFTMTAMETFMVGAAAATTAVSVIAAKQQANAEEKAVDASADARATQVAQQAGQEESAAAMQARQARSQSVVAAGESGINLGSNSFLASLQTTTMNQYENEGLIMENEKNQQNNDQAQVQSELNSKAYSPSFLGGALDVALSGAGAYMSAQNAYKSGVNRRPTADTTTTGVT